MSPRPQATEDELLARFAAKYHPAVAVIMAYDLANPSPTRRASQSRRRYAAEREARHRRQAVRLGSLPTQPQQKPQPQRHIERYPRLAQVAYRTSDRELRAEIMRLLEGAA